MTAAKRADQAAASDGQPGEGARSDAAELELGRLTKVVLEGALEGEMDAHLGYARHDPAGRDGGNSRNGHRAKTVLTDVGPAEIAMPRGPGCQLRAGDRGQAAAAAVQGR